MQHLRQASTQPTSRSASLTGLSPAGQQTSAPAWMRPSIASPSTGEQTSAQTCTRPPSVALSSSGQAAGRQTSAPACTRPMIASPSAGEQTSAQTSTRLPSVALSSGVQQVAGQQTSAPSRSSPMVGESPRRPPLIALAQAGMQTPSPARMRSPSIGLSSGGQTVVGQHTPAPSRPSMVGKSPRIPSRPPLISSITPSSGNPRLGCDIRTPAPHLQSFRPSMSVPAASPSPVLSGRPNMSSYSSSLTHVPLRPAGMSSQISQHKELPLSLQQSSPASISDSLSALELHTNLDNQPNPNRPRQSGWPGCSSPANMSSSSSPSLNHFKTAPLVLDSSQHLQKMDHPLPHPSEPDNRALPAVNISRLSATELLRNLDNQASATQPKQSGGGPGNCIAANSSSSSPSLNCVPSQSSVSESSKLSQDMEQPQPLGANDFNPQNQPAVNIQPFSALELLRNVDNQAGANQPND